MQDSAINSMGVGRYCTPKIGYLIIVIVPSCTESCSDFKTPPKCEILSKRLAFEGPYPRLSGDSMDFFKKYMPALRLCVCTLSGKPANPSMSDSAADQHHDLMICNCPSSIGIEACIFYLCWTALVCQPGAMGFDGKIDRQQEMDRVIKQKTSENRFISFQ